MESNYNKLFDKCFGAIMHVILNFFYFIIIFLKIEIINYYHFFTCALILYLDSHISVYILILLIYIYVLILTFENQNAEYNLYVLMAVLMVSIRWQNLAIGLGMLHSSRREFMFAMLLSWRTIGCLQLRTVSKGEFYKKYPEKNFRFKINKPINSDHIDQNFGYLN